MRARARRRIALAAAGALAVGIVSIASAQERFGGKTLVFTLGQSLRYSDNIDLAENPEDSVLQSRTSLDFAFDSVTRIQRLSVDLGGIYEIDTDGLKDLSNPYLNFSYAREGANSRLDLASRYRRVDLNDSVATFVTGFDPDTGDVITQIGRIEAGIRTNTSNSLRFETGLRSNIGFTLDMSENKRSYSGAASADLLDTRTRRASGVITFRIDPQVSARLTASARKFDANDEDATDRRERSFGAGATYQVSPTLSLDADLRQQRIERRNVSGTTLTEGLAYDGTLRQDLRNGSATVDFDSQPTLNGRRNTLRANRALTLRRDGTLSYGLGVTKTDGFSAEPLLSLAYNQPLKRGRFGVTFSQEARTNELDDEAVILTQLEANYALPLTSTINWSMGLRVNDVAARDDTGEDRRGLNLRGNLTGQINDISSWSAGVTLSDTDTSNLAGAANRRRYGIIFGYRRQMTRDWDLIANYSHNAIRDTAATDRTSNTISIGVEKAFSFRP